MTRERWAKRKKEYQRYTIMTRRTSSFFVWNCVERISKPFIENANNSSELKMFVEIHFKSGESERQYFKIERKNHVTTKKFFGIPIVSIEKFDAQEYFDDEECMRFVNKTCKEWVKILAKNNKG